MRAVGYGRASTTEQVEEGHSLDAQEHAIVEFCRARGWTLVEIYVDPGLSGALEDRPALQRLLRDAAQGKFDVVVAVSYTHLRAHETVLDLVCRLLLEKKKK
mgnify:CR=1 FL=1